ncbi:3'-5' exonuclease [Campylobacter sp. JMF_02 ED1]|uniref:3'-5' exonuclease n=1 Tax=unclassified Campylobacter TaxID=2593542 RepID=UPI0022E9ED65|nr:MULTISPECIES: 3'-5' exonuclease [unclassified Campylobacter]MDA3049524.1 3'-5' exonuclease [Campylobacter sp. JMF_15 NE4]MDA3051049.1 3'-5' exonuclease [Campylobacter sp. JMF_02 ED1]
MSQDSRKGLDNLIELLAQKSINYHDFIAKAQKIELIAELFEPKDFSMWRAMGLNVIKLDNGKITLKTRETDIEDEIFCFVDIETSGGLSSGQIIEIGAIKVQGGRVLDRFESFVYANFVPEGITELTGISASDLVGAPSLASVLERFRLFLGDAIFVAHNVKFDYGFIDASMQKCGFGMLLNRKICTVELARRTIESPKYNLGALKELLGIENTHHRAYSDAISCKEIFAHAISALPWSVQSTEDLILFSRTAGLKNTTSKNCNS